MARLFGDPVVQGKGDVPVSQVQLSIEIVEEETRQRGIEAHGPEIVPDFVDGWALGDVIGLFISNLNSSRREEIMDVRCDVQVSSYVHSLCIATMFDEECLLGPYTKF